MAANSRTPHDIIGDMQAQAEAEEAYRVEVRHVKARLEEAEQEVSKLQERVEGLHDKNETANADLQHAKVRP